MRNLIRFIIRYNFAILFIVFEIFAIILIFNQNPIQRGYLANRFNSLSAIIYGANYKLSQYVQLKDNNDILARENASLRSRAERTDSILNFSKGSFEYIPAQVLNNSVNRVFNYLTLNAGLSDGVEPDMGVISSFGVVGVVKSVSPNYSRVISVLNNQLFVSVKLAKSGYFGSMNWSGGSHRDITISEIPSNAPIEIGDTLLTSGYSALFPPDQLAAVVKSFKPTSGGNFLEIEATLTNDFKKLSTVYIVKNKNKDELIGLEEEL